MSGVNHASLRSVLQLAVHVAPPTLLGEIGEAERRFIPVLGGTLSGSGLSGTIIPGGSDIQRVRADGTIELTARYAVDLGVDGKLLVENAGLRRASHDGTSEQPYFRGVVRFDAPSGQLQWLNDSLFVSTGYRQGETVHLEVFEVL